MPLYRLDEGSGNKPEAAGNGRATLSFAETKENRLLSQFGAAAGGADGYLRRVRILCGGFHQVLFSVASDGLFGVEGKRAFDVAAVGLGPEFELSLDRIAIVVQRGRP